MGAFDDLIPAKAAADPFADLVPPKTTLGVPTDIANDPLLQFDGYQMTPEGFVPAPAPDHFQVPAPPVDRAALGELIGIPMENPDPGNLGDMLLRGFADLPQLATDALELPLNAADALVRALGGDPASSIATAGMRKGLGFLQDATGYLPAELDAAGVGQGSVDAGQLVEALNPAADIPIGQRLGDVGTFALEQGVRATPQMVAAMASLPGYAAGRANQVAETRAGNDGRELVTLPDIGIAVPAAVVESLLERFTTARLLPGGTTAATPGATAALGRVLREIVLQGGLGGVEELAPYLAETVGTELGATGQGALETFAAGAVTEGAMGGTAQGAKEAVRALDRTRPATPQAAPVESADVPSPEGFAPLGETDVIRNAESDAELDALLLRNLTDGTLTPETLAAGSALLGDIDPAAATPTPSTERASLPAQDLVAELQARMRQSSQEQAARAAPPVARTPEVVAEPDGAPPVRGSRYSPLDLRQEIGWSQRGGELVRAPVDQETLSDEERQGLVAQPLGEVTGRTRWTGWPDPTGEESVFWRNRPDKGLSAKAAQAAMDKFERGEPLKPIEQRFIQHAEATAAEYGEAMNLLDDAVQGYAEQDRQRGLEEIRAEIEFAEEDAAEALSLYELMRRTIESGAPDDAIIQTPGESEPAYAARLWRHIQEADRGTDPRAETQDRGQGDPGREGGAERAVAEDQPPLFAPATPREEVAGERRRRDARRDGRGAEAPGFSGTPLGAGPIPSQADVETGELPAQDGATYGRTRPLQGGSDRDGVASPGAVAPGRGARGELPQLDLFVATRGGKPPGQGHEPAVKVDRARLLQSARLVQTGQFRSGVERVRTLADAAHVVSPLRKSAQERFMVLALDADGRPLAVMQHSLGSIDGSSVDTGMVMGAVASIPGVKSVVFAHNHPSGNPSPSSADMSVDQRLLGLFQGSGIDVRGSIIVQPGRRTFTTYGENGVAFRNGPTDNIRPARRTDAVPQVERRLRRVQPTEGRQALTDPSAAQRLVTEHREESRAGVLLLNNHHELSGFIPFDAARTGRLRTGNLETSHARFIAKATEANAAAAILYGDKRNEAGIRNMARAMAAADLRVLDTFVFDGGSPESQARFGRDWSDGTLESVEPFYSAALSAVEEGKGAPKRADAAAWKGWLDGAVRRGDMKQSERDWLGVDAWLDGRETTTREELAEFVRANEVQVQDVVLGDRADVPLPDGWTTVMDHDDEHGFGGGMVVVLDEHGEARGAGDTRRDAILDAQDDDNAQDVLEAMGATKFGQWQLPGGENYRELLLTLPSFDEGNAEAWWNDEGGANEETPFSELSSPDRRDAIMRYREEVGQFEESSDTFRSSHFAHPNILAHVRFNERTDADGKRVLFLEEIQSDWHQAGRKKGYADSDAKRRADEISSEMSRLAADREMPSNRMREESRWHELARERDALLQQAEGIPDAPFKATDEWAMLAFKRMVRHAAENGFERIAWTTGEQQAERYDLSKQVDRIRWRVPDEASIDEGAARRVIVDMVQARDSVSVNVDANGVVISSGQFTLIGKRLDEIIGKEIADKIMSGEPKGAISGDGLNVGGEGMAGFYDSILPKAVNKWAKRFGGRVGHADIKAADMPWSEYEKYAADHPYRAKNAPRVHAIDMTPAMREAALAGLPLFNNEVAESDLSPDESASVSRQRERGQVNRAQQQARATLSRERGESDAASRGLKAAVDKALGPASSRVSFIRGTDALPDHVRTMLESRNRGRKVRTAALYDPETGKAFVLTDVVTDPKRAAFHAAHEIAGHHGLRAMLADQAAGNRTARESLDIALDIALQNPTVKKLADAIGKERNSNDRLLMAEEALAELAAATRTGEYDVIQSRYGVEVPQAQRATLKGAIARFLDRIRALFGRMGTEFSDTQVRELVEGAWRYARGEGSPEAGALESTDDPTQTEAFRRWFGNSAVVDADGKPLVVYHGTASLFDAFSIPADGGAFFSANPDHAAHFTLGRGQVVAAYVSLQNPLIIDQAELDRRHDQVPEKEQDIVLPRMMLDDVLVEARAAGHGGVVVRAMDDLQFSEDVFIAFRPEQIKSATGNRGTFDPDSPSILESVDYTPEQSAALTKAGMPVDRRTSVQRATASIREGWERLRDAARDSDALKASVFDRFHGLRAAEADLALSPEQSPYIAARMTAGLPSVIEGLLMHGAPKWDGGIMAPTGDKGLLDALKPVEGKLNEWLGWMVGRRAELLKSQGREHNFTDADIKALLSLADGNEAAFKQAAKDYLSIKNAVLDVAQEAGLIDPAARAAWDHAEYIPFYRAENDQAIGPGTRKGLAGQTSGIRTLKGGENALADPLANIIRNFAKLIDASMKNRAVLMAVDQLPQLFEPAPREVQPAAIPLDQVKKHLEDQGVPASTIDAMPAQALKGVQRMLSIVPPSGDDVVRVMRDGKAEFHRVKDPLVLRALTAFRTADKSLAMKPLIWFKRLLTTGVTTTAEFVGANFLRDTGSAWVVADDRFVPGWDSLKGMGNTLRNDAGTRDMMMAGATFMGGNFYDGNPDAAAAALRRALRSKGLKDRDIEGFMGTVARSPLQLWDSWLKLSGAVENANRRAVYDAALKAGRSRTEAAYMARDLMDFAMQGDAKWIQFFADVLPFFNARLQGLYKLGRRAGTPRGRRAMILRGGTIALASSALYAWNMLAHQDAYDDLEEWDKDAYWHIAPGTEYHVRIPKPFEIGVVFGTAPERAMEAIRHQNTGEGDDPNDTWSALVRGITGTLSFNPIPQAALPMAEQWANKSFFTGRPIEGMGDEGLLPEDRAEWFTSDTAKLLGKMTGLSPKRIEHLWKGYTAGLGGYVLDASDFLVRKLSDAPDRPDMAKREWPVLGRFLRGGAPARSKYVGEFYEAFREAEQIEQSVKERWVTGDKEGAEELAKENAAILGERVASKRAKGGFMFARVKEMRKVRDQLTALREDIESVVLDGNLSAEQKRQRIDELERQRNKLVRSQATR